MYVKQFNYNFTLSGWIYNSSNFLPCRSERPHLVALSILCKYWLDIVSVVVSPADPAGHVKWPLVLIHIILHCDLVFYFLHLEDALCLLGHCWSYLEPTLNCCLFQLITNIIVILPGVLEHFQLELHTTLVKKPFTCQTI